MATISASYPEYEETARLDELRATEYSYLDSQDHVYLDYTGSGLAAASQFRHHNERVARTLFGNPHSANPTSAAATEAIERTRARVLAHFRASPAEYAVIFTANATGAARLVGEAYPFRRGSRLVLTADNHNSINGLREFAAARGAKTTYIPLQQPELRINHADVISALPPDPKGGFFRRGRLPPVCRGMLSPRLSSNRDLDSNPTSSSSSSPERSNGLFAYPAQSNFTGVRHPLSWVQLAQQRGYDVLLDAAAYLPTSALDLSREECKPQFVLVSWYKLFGYPTGVGCLIARRDALERLRLGRPWFAGGTVQAVMAWAAPTWHALARGVEAFEDGTPNFLSIPDVRFGLDWLDGISMPLIDKRVRCLTGWFLDRLLQMRHSDGSPMARIYGPADLKMRGGTVAFSLLDASGKVVDERLVALESAAARISLRTGCFCNPGAGEAALGVDKKIVGKKLFPPRQLLGGLDQLLDILGIPSLGAIRVSFGLASTSADLDRFFGFVEKTYKDRIVISAGLPPRGQC